MANSNIDYDVVNLDGVTMNVNFNLTRRYKIKVWAATKLIGLAAFILGCGLEIKDEEDNDQA